MASITHAQIQELVKQIPDESLPRAYLFLQKLAAEKTNVSPQAAFLRLPPDERQRQLAEQAQQMKEYYEQTAEDRQEWQSGEFSDEY